MKITIVTKERTWHIDQMEKQAKIMKLDLELRDVLDLNENPDSFGEVVFWRSGSIDKTFGRTAMVNLLKKSGRFVMNSGVAKFPYVTHKFFQQKFAEQYTDCNSIPTFVFQNKKELMSAVSDGKLKFPFIRKPNLGAQGCDISMIRGEGDVGTEKFEGYIFQNYIENDGDYRVLVLGGRPLGFMKRAAAEGSFLNNVSQGGSCSAVNDPEIKEQLAKIAAGIAALFDLSFCGVDIIFDEKNKKYYFLELNTVPQWQGFQGATGINVARNLLEFAIEVSRREQQKTHELVEQNYRNNFEKLNFEKKFHFASRMYLWFGGVFEKELSLMKENFVGLNEKQTKKIFAKCLDDSDSYSDKIVSVADERKKYVKKYPLLGAYNDMLFKVLMARNIYRQDLKEILLETVSRKDLSQLRTSLLSDKGAVFALSTHAVNFLYFLKKIFPENKEFDLNPEMFIDLIKEKSQTENSLKLKIYLLTHCIIGESGFYTGKIDHFEDSYEEMLQILEELILDNFSSVSLDNKLEFLVCAKICSWNSILEGAIMNEAENSFSEIGNFIVDKYNKNNLNFAKKDFFSSEHRNVLYMMAKASENMIQSKIIN